MNGSNPPGIDQTEQTEQTIPRRPPEPGEPTMSTTEVCQALSCSRNTVLIMIQRGDLQAIKRGRDWQIYGDLPDPESIRPGRKCGPQKRIPIKRMQPVVTISLKSIPKRTRNK